jgi:glycosyltransferase involved in cell wall biosynthesis
MVKAHPQLKQNLVLAGKETWFADQVHRAARDSGVADRIQFCGFVSDDDLLQLYNACDLFIFPSFYEGFGLPALEAMARGIPVVTSTRPALGEVFGEAALLVDPRDAPAVAAALDLVLRDGGLRADLVSRGHALAARHSWAACAQLTRAALVAAAEAPS